MCFPAIAHRGMLTAAVIHAPSYGAKVKGFDAAKAKTIKGVKSVVAFETYSVLRMHQMPAVEVHILPSSKPTGVGEPGTPAIAPALPIHWRRRMGLRLGLCRWQDKASRWCEWRRPAQSLADWWLPLVRSDCEHFAPVYASGRLAPKTLHGPASLHADVR